MFGAFNNPRMMGGGSFIKPNPTFPMSMLPFGMGMGNIGMGMGNIMGNMTQFKFPVPFPTMMPR